MTSLSMIQSQCDVDEETAKQLYTAADHNVVHAIAFFLEPSHSPPPPLRALALPALIDHTKNTKLTKTPARGTQGPPEIMNELLSISSPPAFPFPPNANVVHCFVDYAKHAHTFKWNLPQIQRELDAGHVDELHRRFVAEHVQTGTFDFGIFELVSVGEELFLVNGQHRYAALLKLGQEGYRELLLHIRIKTVLSQTQLNEYFCAVNGSKQALICHNTDEQLVINGFKKHMVGTYGATYFPASKRPHKPNMNLDKVVEHMMQIQLLEQLKCTRAKELCRAVDELNNFYCSKMYDIAWWGNDCLIKKDAQKWKDRAQQKNIQTPLFLGIYPDYEWMDRLITHVTQGVAYDSMPHFWKTVHCRKKPSARLREDVWKKRNGKRAFTDGKCYVCQEPLTFGNMQCGHIISYYHGGTGTLSNLEPLCASCNRDMGTENLARYRQRKHQLSS
jgi:5-methylcytosine-specific restriction endonuclease McrA